MRTGVPPKLPTEQDARQLDDLLQTAFDEAEAALAAFDSPLQETATEITLEDVGTLGVLRDLFTVQVAQLETMRLRIERAHSDLIASYLDRPAA